jgi:hypothetical protein
MEDEWEGGGVGIVIKGVEVEEVGRIGNWGICKCEGVNGIIGLDGNRW